MRRSGTSGRLTIVALALCALAASGCCSVPASGIDPTGEHVFTAPPSAVCGDRSNERYYDEPLGQLPWDDVGVDLQPRETVASVGSEVVLVAGVCGADGYLRTNRRLEWSIDPSGVGQFVAVGENGWLDLMLGDFNRPRKLTNVFAIGSTTRTNTRLNRGACRPDEDVYVLRGQGWVSLTSSVEGTSHVTVLAPEVYSWGARLKSSVVHWIDAQWRFPPPAINPAGTQHVFTTTVTRQSNQTPCERWRVRYQIVGGPPAGFLPDGATAIEVPTDSAGQANATIAQKEPRHGTNQISIEVIRPADLPGANGQRLIVGTGTTLKTWTGADLSVKKCGPAVACPGATLTYQIELSNPEKSAIGSIRHHHQAAPQAFRYAPLSSGLDIVRKALASESSTQVWSLPHGGLLLTVAVPVQRYKQVLGAVMLSRLDTKVDAAIREVRLNILELFGMTLLITILLSLYLARAIARFDRPPLPGGDP